MGSDNIPSEAEEASVKVTVYLADYPSNQLDLQFEAQLLLREIDDQTEDKQ